MINLVTDIPIEEDEPIPLPNTISSADFDHCFAWLHIIKNSSDNESAISKILQYTYDHNLKYSTLETLIRIVDFLDIQVPGLLAALENRRDCVKVELQDAEVWISSKTLEQCSVFANALDFENDDPIELPEMNRKMFESIVGVNNMQEKKQENNKEPKFIIPADFVDVVIQADKFGNEILLNEKVDELVKLIKSYVCRQAHKESGICFYNSFDTMCNTVTKVFNSLPESIQFKILKSLELFNHEGDQSKGRKPYKKDPRSFPAISEYPYQLLYSQQTFLHYALFYKMFKKGAYNPFVCFTAYTSNLYRNLPDEMKSFIDSCVYPAYSYETIMKTCILSRRIMHNQTVSASLGLLCAVAPSLLCSLGEEFIQKNFLSTIEANSLAEQCGIYAMGIGLSYLAINLSVFLTKKIGAWPLCSFLGYYSGSLACNFPSSFSWGTIPRLGGT